MATIADFVGTWYRGGDRKQPRIIKLNGKYLSVQRSSDWLSCAFDGNNTIKHNGGTLTGTISSDMKRIAWSDGTSYER